MKVTSIVLGVALVTQAATAQQSTIEIRKIRTLVDRDGRGFNGPPSHIAEIKGGRFVLVESGSSATLPVVIDSTGRFVRLLGRQGGGPGEFNTFVGLDDTRFMLYTTNADDLAQLEIWEMKIKP